MRIAVCGYGRHGKETACKFLADLTGLRYSQSTSQAAAAVVFDQFGKDYGYQSQLACWEDRHNHREEWARIIWEYNGDDGLRLYRDMLSENDILDGIRKQSELKSCVSTGIVDLTLWIDASKRLPPEGVGSCDVSKEDCLLVIDNNGSLENMFYQLYALCHNLLIGGCEW